MIVYRITTLTDSDGGRGVISVSMAYDDPSFVAWLSRQSGYGEECLFMISPRPTGHEDLLSEFIICPAHNLGRAFIVLRRNGTLGFMTLPVHLRDPRHFRDGQNRARLSLDSWLPASRLL